MATQALWLFIGSVVFILCLMLFMLWFGWWASQKRGSRSPYSGCPMMFGVDLPISVGKRINDFLGSFDPTDNPQIDLPFAAICRETKRVFPKCVIKGFVSLSWRFLKDRCAGTWISWGSLTETQKAYFKLHHISLEGFQTGDSSQNRLPEHVGSYHALLKPGPLYVDLQTKKAMGWRMVPDTEFEVLIVKRPDYESIDETL